MSERWWDRDHHAARRERLIERGKIKHALRAHLETQDFIEVDCGQLQRSPGNETHLHGLDVGLRHIDGRRATLYLHTSPEFAAKKLLAAGERRIFDFARVFRNRERGALHAPEFTMLEWYRVEEPYERLMEDCAAMLRLAADVTGRQEWRFRERIMDATAEPERLTVAEAFARHARLDLFALGCLQDFAEGARAIGIRIAHDDTWSDVFSKVLTEAIEPNLGTGRATILYEYPASEAALARISPQDSRVAERFELYACGVELANAFAELTDATEQRRRFEDDMALKQAIYGERYPLDEELLMALPHMPAASGAALGFDRLVMLATGARHIDDVLWTPAPDPFTDQD